MQLSHTRQATRRLENTSNILLLTLIATLLYTPTAAATDNTHSTRQWQEITAGSSCDGSEGLWNCMTSSFQRCASGQWSEVRQCAPSTRCSPIGLTYDFRVDFVNGYPGDTPTPTSLTPPPTTTSRGASVGSRPRSRDALASWWLLGIFATMYVLLL
ncbi:hypothetical protein F5Y14DRAFT_402317 [Nemania sp. NC0429]|nr:hypothetical protein F5Y14DRAFT_402317 [Nemania sp. NC0429]